jgi:hypothetical protein
LCDQYFDGVLLRSNLFPTAEFSKTAVDAHKKSYHRRHANQLLRGNSANEIVSCFAAHIRRPESYSDGPSRGALEVVNTDSEGTGVVFAEDPAVLLDELDQIAIGVAYEDRSDAEIERLVSRAYRSVFALLHVRLEGNVTVLEQSSDDFLQPVDTQCDMPCRVVSVVAGTGTLHKMDRASLVVSQPVGFLRVRRKPEYANVESLRALEIRDAHADMLNAGELHLPFSPRNVARNREGSLVFAHGRQFRIDGGCWPSPADSMLQQDSPGIFVLDPYAD